MEKGDIKEKLIIVGISVGVFLPIRILFSWFVSDDWLGSLGVISLFAVILIVLLKKGKLGWFGKIFEKQMRKTIGGKTGKFIVGFAVFFLIYFGGTLFFIERGNTVYLEDKEIFYLALTKENGYDLNDLSAYQLLGPQLMKYDDKSMQTLSKLDYMFSIAYSVMDEMSEGWLSHIVVVMFVEQIEVIGLLVFFRKTFRQVPPVKTH